MKKLLTAFALSVYCVPASVFLAIFMLSSQEWSDSSGFGPFIIPLIMMLIVCALVVANIAGAIISTIRLKHLSFRAVMVFKLCLIPFYIVNFVCWGIASMVFHIALFIWPLIPFIIAYTYFTVVGTSAHNIANLLTLRRNKRISTKQCVVHCILQFIFIVDVIDCVYLVIKQKKIESVLVQQP